MATLAHIFITPNPNNPLGVIGEVPGENGEVIKGYQLIDIIEQVSKYPESQNFLVHCAGPGGDVNAGTQIYDYLEGLKAEGKIVDTITDGDIGSIMTKVFLAGEKRTISEDHKFYIHAPWTPHIEGNATAIQRGLEGLIKNEENLRAFYKQKTGISDSGLKGLMAGSSQKDGTYISADQAVSLKFATHKAQSKIKAYAQLALANYNSIMSKNTSTLLQQIDAIKANVLALVGITPKVVAIDLEAEDGSKISVGTDDPNGMVGASATVTDAEGNSQPAPDGDKKLKDGRKVKLSGGKVSEVTAPDAPATDGATAQAAAPAAPAPAATPAPTPDPLAALNEKIAALEAKNAAQEEEMKKLKDENEKAAQALTAFQNTLSTGNKPTMAFNNNGGASKPAQGHPISVAMAEIAEKRKQKLNSNK